jgi:nucleoid DNA-binding protein
MVQNQLIKMRTKATIIAQSGLKTSQVIDAIKTFIIPMAEFLLRHSNVSLTKLGSLDNYLRKLINNKIGGLKVTKDTFYLRARDGGFGLLSLKDRYHICKVANMGHLFSSSIGTIYRHHITQVGIDRHILMLNTVEKVVIRDSLHGKQTQVMKLNK